MGPNKNLTMDQAAWKEGFRAAEEGKASCPYPPRCREAWSWQSGFVEGIARSVRNFDSPSKAEELISGGVPENEDPKAVARQARAALVAVRTGLLKCAGELSKSMDERLKTCHAAEVNKSMVDGLTIDEQKVIAPLLKSVAEINEQIGVYDRIEEIEDNKP
jgi:hypothetical protein